MKKGLFSMISNYLRVSENALEKLDGFPAREECLLLLSTVLTFVRQRRELESDDFVTIHSKHLKSLFGKNYRREIIDPLIRREIIECNGSYLKNNYSMSYRLCYPYNKNLVKPVLSPKVKPIIDKLQKLQDERCRARTRLNDFTLKNLRRLEMDTATAREDFKNNHHCAYKDKTFSCIHNPKFSLKAKEAVEMDIAHFEISKRNREFYSIVSNNNSRNYTNFTSMNGNLRGYLSIGDENLALIDIRSSQPFMALRIYKDNVKSSREAMEERESYFRDLTSKDVCFYELINGKPFEGEERGKFKQKVLTAMYDDPNHGGTNAVWQLFKRRYPILARAMEEIKWNAPDWNELALKLQRYESKVMVDGILKWFANNEPGFFLLGLHDGLLFVDTPENRERLKRMIEENCVKYIGYAPETTFPKVERETTWTHKERNKKN